MVSNCCNAKVFIKEKNGAFLIYCSKCGKYVKSATKEERRLLEFEQELQKQNSNTTGTISQFESKSCANNSQNNESKNKMIVEKLEKFIETMKLEIKKEDDQLPLSNIDATRKSSKVYELSRVINSLENILSDKDHNGF